MKKILSFILIVSFLLTNAPAALADDDRRCPNGRSAVGAMWMSIARPGLGEYFLNGFGSWGENMPPRKFWLGFIPVFGWPGYLQVKSARDARRCKTSDGIRWNE